MEVKYNPRTKQKGVLKCHTSTTITNPDAEANPQKSSDRMTLERERWHIENNANQYEKVKFTMGHSCIRKGILSPLCLIIIIIFVIFIIIILTNTLNKVIDLEKKMIHVETQISNTIKSIQEHHNSTFEHLEQKHNELKNQVKNNSRLIASSASTNFRSMFAIAILSSITLLT